MTNLVHDLPIVQSLSFICFDLFVFVWIEKYAHILYIIIHFVIHTNLYTLYSHKWVDIICLLNCLTVYNTYIYIAKELRMLLFQNLEHSSVILHIT